MILHRTTCWKENDKVKIDWYVRCDVAWDKNGKLKIKMIVDSNRTHDIFSSSIREPSKNFSRVKESERESKKPVSYVQFERRFACVAIFFIYFFWDRLLVWMCQGGLICDVELLILFEGIFKLFNFKKFSN